MRRRFKIMAGISVLAALAVAWVFMSNQQRFFEFFTTMMNQNMLVFFALVALIGVGVLIYFAGGFGELWLTLKAYRFAKGSEKMVEWRKARETALDYITENWQPSGVLYFLGDFITPIYQRATTYHGFMFTTYPNEGDRRIGLNTKIPEDKMFGVVINRTNGEPESDLFTGMKEMRDYAFQKHFASRPQETKKTEIEKKIEEATAGVLGAKAAEKMDVNVKESGER